MTGLAGITGKTRHDMLPWFHGKTFLGVCACAFVFVECVCVYVCVRPKTTEMYSPMSL